MRPLFADLLPDTVNARQSKAYFDDAFVHGHSRHSCSVGTAPSLDPELVDANVSRETWNTPDVHSGTFQLMQVAWRASQASSA